MSTTFGQLEGALRRGTSDPVSPAAGDMYYETTNNRWMRYDGTVWRGLAVTTSTSTSTSRTTSTSTTTTSTSTTTTSTSVSTSTSTSISVSTSTSTTV